MWTIKDPRLTLTQQIQCFEKSPSQEITLHKSRSQEEITEAENYLKKTNLITKEVALPGLKVKSLLIKKDLC